MSYLPVPSDRSGALSVRHVMKAARAQTKAELTVFRHGLAARVQSECDALDSEAVASAARAALDEELDLLDYGMSRAGRSAAKIELVANYVELVSTVNRRRIKRSFQ